MTEDTTNTEQRFGLVRFEIEPVPTTSGVKYATVYWLTEDSYYESQMALKALPESVSDDLVCVTVTQTKSPENIDTTESQPLAPELIEEYNQRLEITQSYDEGLEVFTKSYPKWLEPISGEELEAFTCYIQNA